MAAKIDLVVHILHFHQCDTAVIAALMDGMCTCISVVVADILLQAVYE